MRENYCLHGRLARSCFECELINDVKGLMRERDNALAKVKELERIIEGVKEVLKRGTSRPVGYAGDESVSYTGKG